MNKIALLYGFALGLLIPTLYFFFSAASQPSKGDKIRYLIIAAGFALGAVMVTICANRMRSKQEHEGMNDSQ